jgi:flavorubredoxin
VDSPPVIESARGLPAVDTVAREIAERMHWLREASYPQLIEGMERIFAERDVRMIAPAHGCVIRGREAVTAHVRLAVQALRAAGRIVDRERARYV